MKTAVKERVKNQFPTTSFSKRKVKKNLLFNKKLPDKQSDGYHLNERIKELSVLYNVGQILVDEQTQLDKILQRTANILPSGWQYPEITAARIILGEREFKTKNFTSLAPHKLESKFQTPDKLRCIIEIVYLKEKPEEYYDAFLKEERKLLDMVARMLKVYLAHRNAEAERSRITHHLIQRNKSLEEFAFIVSHKIRAPVANIIGMCDVLHNEDLSEEEKKEFIKNLQISVKIFDETIKYLNSILQFNKF